MPIRIGYVEDEPTTRKNYTELLEQRGYRVEAFGEARTALTAFEMEMPDVVLLDLALGEDREAGFLLCQAVRQLSPTVPIIFLTSSDEGRDEEIGFAVGADDYVTKGGKSNRIVVRIKALIRRREVLMSDSKGSSRLLERGSLEIRCEESICFWKGKRVPLTLTGYWLVECLADRPGSVKSSDQLQDAANLTVQPNTIASHVSGIRKTFKGLDPDFDAIKNERGIGYRWLE